MPSLSLEDTDVQFIKGVGPRLGAVFSSRGISTVKELLYFFPRQYEDRSQFTRINALQDGVKACVSAEVVSSRRIPARNRTMLEARVSDSTGTLSLKWFHAPRGMESRFTPGAQLIVTGTIKSFMGKPEMVHPEITWGASMSPVAANTVSTGEADPHVGRVVPIYTEIEGISSRVLRKVLWEAIQKYAPSLAEDLPGPLLKKHGLPNLAQAVSAIHFPADQAEIRDFLEFRTPFHGRLIYDEFLKFEYLVLKQRLYLGKEMAPAFGSLTGPKAIAELEALLPFQLTRDQKKAIQDILKDLSQSHPMNRLIQGDVGSGKTAVALLTAGFVLAEGSQAALMAPTEILAEQHFRNAVRIFGGRLNVQLLLGKTPQSERKKLYARLQSGEPLLLIGTHALIEEPVAFANLSYIMIDEQHRFGVEQRRALRHKGTRQDQATNRPVFPHTLILTATPIPRTLALTAYGDLAVSSIRELPPGRTPILTRVIREKSEKGQAFEAIRRELKAGHQAYFIYPLVNESEAEGFTALKSAVMEAETLAQEIFPEFSVGLLHGQMKSEEKSSIMERFKAGEIQVLVSTTVVEVGVDVPNATVMVVEHAERFGLSQLHQLRGRVGRGSAQSHCFLFSHPKTSEITSQRLDVLEQTQDGFKLAEFDLEIRGPGEFLGTRQAGGLPFRLGNIVRDREWLLKAREDAIAILKEDPELERPEHLPLRTYYLREGRIQFERLKTS